jgi:hypothetical protein
MTLRWQNISVDSTDPVRAATFLRVPEEKSVKNGLHLDLRPDDQAAEVARLEGLGARRAPSAGELAQ